MDKKPKTPSPATRRALVSLLRGDPGITPAHRARIVAAFDDATGERPKGLLPASAVAADLGLELTTLLRWIDDGKVEGRRVGERLTLVDRESVAAYASTRKRAKDAP